MTHFGVITLGRTSSLKDFGNPARTKHNGVKYKWTWKYHGGGKTLG